MAKPKKKEIDQSIADFVYDEYLVGRRNQSFEDQEFQSVLDILECRRTEKDYDWMADQSLPEYLSIYLTESSQWANQYFQTRDFVEVYLGDSASAEQAQAAKRYINNMLNIRELFHYHKYIRARSINATRGYVIVTCSWKQKVKKTKLEEVEQVRSGNNPETGEMEYMNVPREIENEEVEEDRFDYEVWNPNNVVMDDKYCYTLQDKSWIIFNASTTYEDLVAEEEECGYFNLAQVKKLVPQRITDAEKDADLDNQGKEIPDHEQRALDKYIRLGKMWAKDVVKDADGYPITAKPGYDHGMKPLPGAELIECIVTTIRSGGKSVLIRFQPTPFRTKRNIPFKPVIRGLCYIHPTKDTGLSDGRHSREIQALINDMVNMAIDRGKLSMMPTLKVRRHLLEDNDSIYFEPEHPIPVENKDDIEEIRIDGNLQPAIEIATLAIAKMQQVNSIYPPTMGQVAGGTHTATEIAGTESRTNLRSNYKSLTWEYTFFAEFYWMMLQMGYQFMKPQTAVRIMGDKAQNFDPDGDFTYTPVTSNIEVEYNKNKKIQAYDQMLGRIANIPNPAIVPVIAHIVGKQCVLLGEEYDDIKNLVEKLAKTPNKEDKKTEGNAPTDMENPPIQNQSGLPQSPQEEQVRSSMIGA